MRILLVVHRYPPEFPAGTELHTASLASELAARGDDVAVFAGSPGAPLSRRRVRDGHDGSVAVRYLETPMEPDFTMGYRNEWARREFERMLDEVEPDVVHVQHLLYLSADLVEAAKARGIPTVVTLHDFWFQCPLVHHRPGTAHPARGGRLWGLHCLGHYESKRWRAPLLLSPPHLARTVAAHLRRPAFMRRQLELADAVIAPSAFVRDRFAAFGVPREKIVVRPHPVRAESVAPPATDGGVRFGFVGSIAASKGVHVLCEAFARVAGPSTLRLFGTTPEPRYFARVKRGLDLRISYAGAFDPARLGEAYEQVDVVVVPSLVEESFSLVAWEAQAHGRPVVASALGALPEVVEHGRNGLLVPPDDVDALAAALARCTEAGEVERMAAAARPAVDVPAYTESVGELYADVTRSAGRAPSTASASGSRARRRAAR